MNITTITPPTDEPITLDDAKAHLRITHTDEDALILLMITAARQQAEAITGRVFMTQTLELSMDTFPARIHVPFAPLQSVVSLKYLDVSGTEQTYSDILLWRENGVGRIAPAWGGMWPDYRAQPGAIKLRCIAGYATADEVPQAIKHWLLCYIGALYENRESASERPASPGFIDGLLDQYRINIITN